MPWGKELDSKQSVLGASVGSGIVAEGSFNTDGKYVEISVGGGVGASAEVYLIPIDPSFEESYNIFTIPLFFDLSSKLHVGRYYEGAPNVAEWENMLNGEGW